MTIRSILHKTTASSFKPVAGGYLLQTSHPWLLGTGPRYIVTEVQKERLIAVIPARHPLLLTTLVIAWCLVFGIGESHLVSIIFARQPTTIDRLGSMIAAGLPCYVVLVVMIRRRLRRMAPILAEAAPAQ